MSYWSMKRLARLEEEKGRSDGSGNAKMVIGRDGGKLTLARPAFGISNKVVRLRSAPRRGSETVSGAVAPSNPAV